MLGFVNESNRAREQKQGADERLIQYTRERIAQDHQLVKCYAGNGGNWVVNATGASFSGA